MSIGISVRLSCTLGFSSLPGSAAGASSATDSARHWLRFDFRLGVFNLCYGLDGGCRFNHRLDRRFHLGFFNRRFRRFRFRRVTTHVGALLTHFDHRLAAASHQLQCRVGFALQGDASGLSLSSLTMGLFGWASKVAFSESVTLSPLLRQTSIGHLL